MISNRELERNIIGNWIVPSETLLGYIYSKQGDMTQCLDQTLWVIDTYKNGYFNGKCYLSLDQKSISVTNLIGSVTPLGDVLISFVSESAQTFGSGRFVKIEHEYKFVMQMNSDSLEHWSYMIKVTPNDCDYWNLPGLNISVPVFIESFDS